ncbi:hypothetical protein M422DRAFT_70710 [Sphaerobolus stellatus SS14]|uniref:Uncharacterized protein n=1 Tax=Sphaerobolus stellatus (strain SS14) TaxID=990650 RepID=A0A0C9USH9_SPHS4|nr:hypothetical protein M422DRAFT_70710 [Sphaerobolus stellatus SS14]
MISGRHTISFYLSLFCLLVQVTSHEVTSHGIRKIIDNSDPQIHYDKLWHPLYLPQSNLSTMAIHGTGNATIKFQGIRIAVYGEVVSGNSDPNKRPNISFVIDGNSTNFISVASEWSYISPVFQNGSHIFTLVVDEPHDSDSDSGTIVLDHLVVTVNSSSTSNGMPKIAHEVVAGISLGVIGSLSTIGIVLWLLWKNRHRVSFPKRSPTTQDIYRYERRQLPLTSSNFKAEKDFSQFSYGRSTRTSSSSYTAASPLIGSFHTASQFPAGSSVWGSSTGSRGYTERKGYTGTAISSKMTSDSRSTTSTRSRNAAGSDTSLIIPRMWDNKALPSSFIIESPPSAKLRPKLPTNECECATCQSPSDRRSHHEL